MSGFEIAGLALGAIPAILGGPTASSLAAFAWILKRWNLIRNVYQRDGILTVLLFGVLPDSSVTLGRIDKALAGTVTGLLEFRQSLSSNMNMVAIAVSFLLQCAVTVSCARLTSILYRVPL
jgi:hypothetical protein